MPRVFGSTPNPTWGLRATAPQGAKALWILDLGIGHFRFENDRAARASRHSIRKKTMADDMSMNPTRDDFSALLDESLGGRDFMEGQVVHGKVVAIEKDIAIIDVGLKTEGRVSLKEFGEEEGKD